jgi:hypothetical protein
LPNTSFASELRFHAGRLGGKVHAFQLDPLDGDHWLFYYAKHNLNFCSVFPMFDIKLHEVHPDAAARLVWGQGEKEGLEDLFPGMAIGKVFFEPHSYLMNAAGAGEY